MSNQVTKLLEATKEPLILVSMDYLQKHKKKEASLDQIREDFSDATLLNLLLFEENNKVRLSICKAISAILDGYHSEKSLSGVDTVSQVFKNLSFGVTIAVLFEDDEAFFNHLLRVIIFHKEISNVILVDCHYVSPPSLRKGWTSNHGSPYQECSRQDNCEIPYDIILI